MMANLHVHAEPQGTQTAPPAEQGSAPRPEIAPNWILPDTHGTPVSLYSLAESGKTTVMVFWATWCEACETLLPQLAKLNKQEKTTSLHIILMNAWEDDDPLKYLQKHQFDLPVILQTEMVAQRYGITTAPGIVIVSPDKSIAYIHGAGDTYNGDKVMASLRSLTPEAHGGAATIKNVSD